ncbi:MAG: hypothetical protein MJ154_02940 [Candidatus Saccharibacteria bacterium]|nr:hypothetical protein [Candidatus Saccharibacteria bacterium]
MSENIIVQKEVSRNLHAAIQRKAHSFDIKEAVYFSVAFSRRAPAVVNYIDIKPIALPFANWGEYRDKMIEYLNANIGILSTALRKDGMVKIDAAPIKESYVVSIYGQAIGRDIFLSGILAKSDCSDRVDLILQNHDYSLVENYLKLSNS